MIEIKPAKYLKPPKPAKERLNDSLVNKLNLLEIKQNGKLLLVNIVMTKIWSLKSLLKKN